MRLKGVLETQKRVFLVAQKKVAHLVLVAQKVAQNLPDRSFLFPLIPVGRGLNIGINPSKPTNWNASVCILTKKRDTFRYPSKSVICDPLGVRTQDPNIKSVVYKRLICWLLLSCISQIVKNL